MEGHSSIERDARLRLASRHRACLRPVDFLPVYSLRVDCHRVDSLRAEDRRAGLPLVADDRVYALLAADEQDDASRATQTARPSQILCASGSRTNTNPARASRPNTSNSDGLPE